jgi:membrane-bound lytic murein transglycosylase MltF
MKAKIELAAVVLGGLASLISCGGGNPPAQKTTQTTLPAADVATKLPVSVRDVVLKSFTGDLDEIVKRRAVRLGVTFNRTFYFVDRGVQRGVAYEYGELMEQRLNEYFRTDNSNRIHVMFVPLPRETLLSALVHGQVDIVAAQVPVTNELKKYVAFSDPTRKKVNQIVVSGPGAAKITSVDDLAGKEVFAREFGGYAKSVAALNDTFKARGKPPVIVRTSPPELEDDDLLEMVNA